MKISAFIFAALLTMVVALPSLAIAGDDDMVICPAVHPCNPDGSVQAPFNAPGVCGMRYAKECMGEKLNTAVKECLESHDSLQDEVKSLARKNKQLQKQVRVLKRNHR